MGKRISDLPILAPTAAFEGGELFPVVKDGTTYKASASSIFIPPFGTPSQLEPELVKFAGNPLLEPGDTTFATLYWPWVVKVEGLIAGPIDAYYLYYSTDHAPGQDAAIGMATAPTPEGPWTNYGEVYRDRVDGGGGTETPSVIWNEATSLFHMYYQQLNIGVDQSTCLATSPDGITWTRVGMVIDIPSTAEVAGNGHTGYFRPFRVGGFWAGYHLYGGGSYSRNAISYSDDGITWTTDPRPIMNNPDLTRDIEKRATWHQLSVVHWHDQLWAIFQLSDFTAGGPGENVREIAAAPLAPNLRQLLTVPKVILEASEPWESPDIRGIMAFADGQDLYVYYLSYPSIGVAKAVRV